MTPFMQLLLVMALLIGGAKLAAIFSLRLGRPTLFGALIFGLLLGPSLLDIFGRGWFEPEVTQTVVSTMASLGALFIMAQLGLLCDWEVLRSPNRTVLLVGVFSTLIPLLLGILITRLYSVSTTNAIWIGVVLAATSINVISQMLQAYGKFEGTVGTTILGAATVGSILSVILFTLCMALLPAESIGLAARTFVQLLVFLVGITLLGIWLLPRLFARAERLPIAYPTPTIALIVLLLLAWSSEQIGLMSAASGAFLAGLLFRHIDQRALIADGLELLSITVFVPLFYISIGLSVNLRQLLVGDFLGIAVLLCGQDAQARCAAGGCGHGVAGRVEHHRGDGHHAEPDGRTAAPAGRHYADGAAQPAGRAAPDALGLPREAAVRLAARAAERGHCRPSVSRGRRARRTAPRRGRTQHYLARILEASQARYSATPATRR
jgi:Kef-type K+ transport system membrane component KefB